jgi:tetratricopeptide (TPR) repeat protein
MSDDVRTTEQDWIYAREANALRQQGQTTRAIERYDEVITTGRNSRDHELLAYGYAGRGAVKMALGFYSARDPREPDVDAAVAANDDSRTRGAIEDLVQAAHFDPSNGWAWAQLGEAHRSFARDFFRLMPSQRFQQHIQKALLAFEKAALLLPEQQAWVLAHQAGTHFVGIWRAYNIDTAQLPDLSLPPQAGDSEDVWEAKKHRIRAEEGFRAALTANPNYAWAKRFLAYLLTITGRYEEAQALLANALLDDPRAELHVIRSLSMLYRYAAEASDVAPAERQRLLQLALRAGQQTMERDPEDFFGIYAHAAAGAAMGVPDADAICREARGRILNQAARAIAMACALHTSSGDAMGEFLEVLKTAIRNFHLDPELIAIAHHDPVWTRARTNYGGNLLHAVRKQLEDFLEDRSA